MLSSALDTTTGTSGGQDYYTGITSASVIDDAGHVIAVGNNISAEANVDDDAVGIYIGDTITANTTTHSTLMGQNIDVSSANNTLVVGNGSSIEGNFSENSNLVGMGNKIMTSYGGGTRNGTSQGVNIFGDLNTAATINPNFIQADADIAANGGSVYDINIFGDGNIASNSTSVNLIGKNNHVNNVSNTSTVGDHNIIAPLLQQAKPFNLIMLGSTNTTKEHLVQGGPDPNNPGQNLPDTLVPVGDNLITLGSTIVSAGNAYTTVIGHDITASQAKNSTIIGRSISEMDNNDTSIVLAHGGYFNDNVNITKIGHNSTIADAHTCMILGDEHDVDGASFYTGLVGHKNQMTTIGPNSNGIKRGYIQNTIVGGVENYITSHNINSYHDNDLIQAGDTVRNSILGYQNKAYNILDTFIGGNENVVGHFNNIVLGNDNKVISDVITQLMNGDTGYDADKLAYNNVIIGSGNSTSTHTPILDPTDGLIIKNDSVRFNNALGFNNRFNVASYNNIIGQSNSIADANSINILGDNTHVNNNMATEGASISRESTLIHAQGNYRNVSNKIIMLARPDGLDATALYERDQYESAVYTHGGLYTIPGRNFSANPDPETAVPGPAFARYDHNTVAHAILGSSQPWALGTDYVAAMKASAPIVTYRPVGGSGANDRYAGLDNADIARFGLTGVAGESDLRQLVTILLLTVKDLADRIP